jgi:hypothetical protein
MKEEFLDGADSTRPKQIRSLRANAFDVLDIRIEAQHRISVRCMTMAMETGHWLVRIARARGH